MTTVLRHKRHMVHVGKTLHDCGRMTDYYAPMDRLKDYMTAPVVVSGQQQALHFANFRPRAYAVNWRGTALFDRPGFYIHGPAILVQKTEKWHCLRVYDSYENVQAKIAHVTFKDAYAVVPTTMRYDNHQDVIARDETDIILMKMVL